MAVNKVEFGGETLMDLTEDTVTASTLAEGVTAHDASGEKITGTLNLDAYQTKEDNSLKTVNKTIVGAINELNSMVNGSDSTLIGDQTFKNTISLTHSVDTVYSVKFNCNGTEYEFFRVSAVGPDFWNSWGLYACNGEDGATQHLFYLVDNSGGSLGMTPGWQAPFQKNIEILEEPDDPETINWLNINLVGRDNGGSGESITVDDELSDTSENPVQNKAVTTAINNLNKVTGELADRIDNQTPSEGLSYKLNDDGVSYAVSGIGTCTDANVVIPSSYEGLPVTSIGRYAFFGNTSIVRAVIPNSVTSIGSQAFYNCSSLTSITIPNSVTSIGHHAFNDCTSLASVTIPNSVTNIDDAVFCGCSALANIAIPSSVISIGGSAFIHCSSVTSIIIPNSVTSIGNSAFADCTSLTSITIPNSVTTIDNYAFARSTSLSIYCEAESQPETWASQWNSFNRPVTWGYRGDFPAVNEAINELSDTVYGTSEGLTYTLNGDGEGYTVSSRSCTGRNIVIPSSYNDKPVTSIQYSAFERCTSLTSITIPNSVTSIGNYAFAGCTSLTSIIIPNSVTSIEHNTFNGCTSLTSITIPNSVISIGLQAFRGCSSLTNITIPNSVTSIGNYTFNGCTSLTSITIPNSVTSIGDYTFYPKTIHIYCEAEAQPETWASQWNSSNCPVTWGYRGDFPAVNEAIDNLEASVAELDTADKIDGLHLNSSSPTISTVDDYGIEWTNELELTTETGFCNGSIPMTGYVPIVAGDNITFNVTDDNKYVKINATGGGSETCMPQIRFVGMPCDGYFGTVDFTEITGESYLEDRDIQFTVEIVGGGPLQVGDAIQLCGMKLFGSSVDKNGKYHPQKRKLRRVAEHQITEDDLNKRFITMTVDWDNEKAMRLFTKTEFNNGGCKSPMYFRIRRSKGNINQNTGMTVDAEFSNVVTVWKSYAYYTGYDEETENEWTFCKLRLV